jgi:protein TonB
LIRPTTSPRIPPAAVAAAAGLHLVVGAAALASWQAVPPIDEALPVAVELAVLAAPPAEPEPAPAAAAAEPESQPASPPDSPPAEPEPPAFDPSVIPEPEPPPPLVLERPKAPQPKPAVSPPRPAARPPPPAAVAPSIPAPAAAAPAAPAHDPSYLDRLAAAIERERDYPLQSRRQGHQGRVVLHLVIAASGRLLESRVAAGSGIEALDRAALGMVRRATLPPLAPALGAESAAFTVPIVFALRR